MHRLSIVGNGQAAEADAFRLGGVFLNQLHLVADVAPAASESSGLPLDERTSDIADSSDRTSSISTILSSYRGLAPLPPIQDRREFMASLRFILANMDLSAYTLAQLLAEIEEENSIDDLSVYLNSSLRKK